MKGGNMKSFCDSVFRLEFATASSGSGARPLLSPGTAGWHQEASTQHHTGDSAENINSVDIECPPPPKPDCGNVIVALENCIKCKNAFFFAIFS